MVKPGDLNKRTHNLVKVNNNTLLQGQSINTKQTLKEQTKVTNPDFNPENKKQIDNSK